MMKKCVIIWAAFFVAGNLWALKDAPVEKPLSIYAMPSVWPHHEKLRLELMGAIQRGDIQAMETIARAGVKLMPADATWHYNLACALAYRDKPGLALSELDKAVTFGFRDWKKIQSDSDFNRIKNEPRFREILEKAAAMVDLPVPNRPIVVPAVEVLGAKFELTSTNLLWNYDYGVFDAQIKSTIPAAGEQAASYASRYKGPAAKLVPAWMAEGSAAGNSGDLYVNRDRGHSAIDTTRFPLLSAVGYETAALLKNLDKEFPNTLFPANRPVVGNASLARVGGPFWRSLPRAAFTDPEIISRMQLFYLSNQFWVFPAHKDYGDPAIGDVLPAMTPLFLMTQGSSFTDLPFVDAAFAASASFTYETKKALLAHGLFAPTLQWLFRRTLPGVAEEADYLSARAHPTVFKKSDLNVEALVLKAHKLTPQAIPPVAGIGLVSSKLFPIHWPEPGRDLPDVSGEVLFITPISIALVLKGIESERTFLVKAKALPGNVKNATFAWRVVHGNAAAVKITQALGEKILKPETGLAQITINQRLMTNRIDIAIFARTKNTEFGAPSFISFSPVPQETREYDKQGRLIAIDYSNPNEVYSDPALAYPRTWRDEYKYDEKGHCTGYERFYGTRHAASFLPTGERVVWRNADGSPKKIVRVKYVPRNVGRPDQVPELTYVDDGDPFPPPKNLNRE